MENWIDDALEKFAVEGAAVALSRVTNGGQTEKAGYGLALRHSGKSDSCWILTCDHLLHGIRELQLGGVEAKPIWRGTAGKPGADAALLQVKGAPSDLPWSRGVLFDLDAAVEYPLRVSATIPYAGGSVDMQSATLSLAKTVTVEAPCRCGGCALSVSFSYEAFRLTRPQDVRHGLSGLPFRFPLVRPGRGQASERNAWVGNLTRAVSETPDIARRADMLPLRAFRSALHEYAGVEVLDVQLMLARLMALSVKKHANQLLGSRVSDEVFLDIEPHGVTQANHGAGVDSDDCGSMLVEAEGGAGKTVWLFRHARKLADTVLGDVDNRTVLCVGNVSEVLQRNSRIAKAGSLLGKRIDDMKPDWAISGDLSGLLCAWVRESDNGRWEDVRLLLDGLDQTPGLGAYDLPEVLKRYPRTLVTSRLTTAKENQPRFASHRELARPSHRQVREYLGATVYERLRAGRGIAADLLRLPLYVQPLRKLGPDVTPPSIPTRAHYFERFWDGYLMQENEARKATRRNPGRVEDLYGFAAMNRKLLDLALRMSLGERIQSVDRDWSEWEEEAREVAEWWRSKGEPCHFLEIEPPPGDLGEARSLGFIHQSWQEYLAARKIAGLRPDEQESVLDQMARYDSGGPGYDLWSSVARFLAGTLELEGRKTSHGLALLRGLCRRGAFRIGFVVTEEWRRRESGGDSRWDWNDLPDQIHHLRWLCWQMVRYRQDADAIYPDDIDERYIGAPRCALRALAQLDDKSRRAFQEGVQSYCERLSKRRTARNGPRLRPVEIVGLLELLAGADGGQATPGAALLGESDLLGRIEEWTRRFFDPDPQQKTPPPAVPVAEYGDGLGYQPSAARLLDWISQRLEEDPPQAADRRQVEEVIKTLERSDTLWYEVDAKNPVFVGWLGATYVHALAGSPPPPAAVSYALFNQAWSDGIKQRAINAPDVINRAPEWLQGDHLDRRQAALWLVRPWLELHSESADLPRMAEALWIACRKVEESGQTAQLFGFIQELLRLPQTSEQQQWLRRHLQARWCTEVVLIDYWLDGRPPEQWLVAGHLLNDARDYLNKHWYYWLIAPILVGGSATEDGRWLEDLVDHPGEKDINPKTRSVWEQEQMKWCARAVRNLLALPDSLNAAVRKVAELRDRSETQASL